MQKVRLDLIGKKYNRLTVIEYIDNTTCKHSRWRCKCDCGNEIIVRGSNLVKNHVGSCGCLRHESYNTNDLTGKRFGVLTVIEFSHSNKRRNFWKCVCDCGASIISPSDSLVTGHTKGHRCDLTMGLPDNTAAKNKILDRYKRQAKERNFQWALGEEEAFQLFSNNCHYCGVAPSNFSKGHNKKKSFIYSGIDRLDSSKGYELNNVVSCCAMCNRAKLNMPYQEFMSWIDRLIKNQSKVKVAKNSN